ncbi:hypothetical protein [Roseisolibacter agri]|nr:hypothetical protein [Roseisolibacter agri]
MPKIRTLVSLNVAALSLLAACSDAPTVPTSSRLAPADAPSLASYTIADTTVSTFDYNPLLSYDLSLGGGDRLSVPAGSVCDPNLSGYGPSLWDAPCVPQLLPLQFTVRTWRDGTGRPRMVVTPDVRFVPGSNVVLRFKDDVAAAGGKSVIVWCPTGALTCVNEGLQDASMITKSNPNNGFVYRRLKHFSGYNVVVDRSGEEPISDTGFGFE